MIEKGKASFSFFLLFGSTRRGTRRKQKQLGGREGVGRGGATRLSGTTKIGAALSFTVRGDPRRSSSLTSVCKLKHLGLKGSHST